MPASYVIDRDRRVVFVRCWGVLVESDLSKLSKDSEQRTDTHGFDRLINLTDVAELRLSSDAIRSLAEVARNTAVGRRALVASGELAFGLARMFELNLRLPEEATGVFRSLPGALSFLGLDPDTPWPDQPPDYSHGT